MCVKSAVMVCHSLLEGGGGGVVVVVEMVSGGVMCVVG